MNRVAMLEQAQKLLASGKLREANELLKELRAAPKGERKCCSRRFR